MGERTLEALKYKRSEPLLVLDQLKLPEHHEYIPVESTEQAWTTIRNMNVRGAPAIAIVASLSLAVDLERNLKNESNLVKLKALIELKLKHLLTSRPTAVNLQRAVEDLKALLVEKEAETCEEIRSNLVEYAEKLFAQDIEDNKKMGEFGAEHVMQKTGKKSGLRILTHCNTGSLATGGGGGTALGVIRALHSKGALEKVYCTETRPYNQGSRLTAYELVFEGLPGCLVCDDMVGALMRTKGIDAVILGCDRICRNGDLANKIGTYQLSVLASHHKVLFYSALPTTTIDLKLKTGLEIPIEVRPAEEMTSCGCKLKNRVPPVGIDCWNPAFDVTPAQLITGGIITEHGVFQPPLDTKENLAGLKMKL